MYEGIIIDVTKTEDENFSSILEATESALEEAIDPFIKAFECKSIDEFIQMMRYDRNALYTTTVYGVLNFLSIIYSEDIPKKKILENIPAFDSGLEEDMNRKRISRIQSLFSERNAENLIYFNHSYHEPRMMATDALWYDLLSEFPTLKRFLFNTEAIITKRFFEELKNIYNYINKYKGYDRFYLRHKLEMCSKLELFYKILALIKIEKRRLKLSGKSVNLLIGSMAGLHKIPYTRPAFEFITNWFSRTAVYDEILSLPKINETLNSIIFNSNNIAMHYMIDQEAATNFTELINFIYNAVVFHLSCKIIRELSLADNEKGFDLIKKIQHSNKSTEYFETFLKDTKTINFENFEKNITFTHFKKIYNLKPERAKKT